MTHFFFGQPEVKWHMLLDITSVVGYQYLKYYPWQTRWKTVGILGENVFGPTNIELTSNYYSCKQSTS